MVAFRHHLFPTGISSDCSPRKGCCCCCCYVFFCVSSCFAFFSGSDIVLCHLCHFFWKGLMGLPLFGGVSDAFIYDVFFGGRAVGWVWGVCHMGFSNKFIVSRREWEKYSYGSTAVKSCSPLARSDLTKEGLSIWLLAIPSIKNVMIPLSRLMQSKPASSFAEVLKNAGVSFIVSIPIMILPLVDSLRKSCSVFFSFCLILSVLSWCFLQGVWNWQGSRAYMIPGWKSPAISQWFFANFEVNSLIHECDESICKPVYV